jgi:hypothetical protein
MPCDGEQSRSDLYHLLLPSSPVFRIIGGRMFFRAGGKYDCIFLGLMIMDHGCRIRMQSGQSQPEPKLRKEAGCYHSGCHWTGLINWSLALIIIECHSASGEWQPCIANSVFSWCIYSWLTRYCDRLHEHRFGLQYKLQWLHRRPLIRITIYASIAIPSCEAAVCRLYSSFN